MLFNPLAVSALPRSVGGTRRELSSLNILRAIGEAVPCISTYVSEHAGCHVV